MEDSNEVAGRDEAVEGEWNEIALGWRWAYFKLGFMIAFCFGALSVAMILYCLRDI